MKLSSKFFLLLFVILCCLVFSAAQRQLKKRGRGKGKYHFDSNQELDYHNRNYDQWSSKSEDYYKDFHVDDKFHSSKENDYHYKKKRYAKGKGKDHIVYKGKANLHYHYSEAPTQPPMLPSNMPTDLPTSTATPKNLPRRMILNMKGTSTGERLEFPSEISDLQLLCFQNLPLYDLYSNATIGKGSNCISFITNTNETTRLNIISETTTILLDNDCNTAFTFVVVPHIVPIQKGPTGFVVSTIGEQKTNNPLSANSNCFFLRDTEVSVRLSGFILVDAINTTFTFDYIYVVNLADEV